MEMNIDIEMGKNNCGYINTEFVWDIDIDLIQKETDTHINMKTYRYNVYIDI